MIDINKPKINKVGHLVIGGVDAVDLEKNMEHLYM